MVAFSIDNQVNMPFKNDDYKVVLRPSGLGVSDMVCALDLACENILVNIPETLYGFLAEEHCRFDWFGPFFCHLNLFESSKIVKL